MERLAHFTSYFNMSMTAATTLAVLLSTVYLLFAQYMAAARRQLLRGKTVLVTGAGSGIGRSICVEAARAGADAVIGWDVNAIANAQTQSLVAAACAGRVPYVLQTVDVSSGEAVAAAEAALRRSIAAGLLSSSGATSSSSSSGHAQLLSTNGSRGAAGGAGAMPSSFSTAGGGGDPSALLLGPAVDVLISCAGVVTGKDAHTLTEKEVSRTLAINTGAHFNLLRSFLPSMRARKSGTVVLIASVMGLVGSARLSDYCASKWASIAVAESLRLELSRDGLARPWWRSILPAWVLQLQAVAASAGGTSSSATSAATGGSSSATGGNSTVTGSDMVSGSGVCDGVSVVTICPYAVATGMFRGIFGERATEDAEDEDEEGEVVIGLQGGGSGKTSTTGTARLTRTARRALRSLLRVPVIGTVLLHSLLVLLGALLELARPSATTTTTTGTAAGIAPSPEPWVIRSLLRPLFLPMLTSQDVAAATVTAAGCNVDAVLTLPAHAWWLIQLPRAFLPVRVMDGMTGLCGGWRGMDPFQGRAGNTLQGRAAANSKPVQSSAAGVGAGARSPTRSPSGSLTGGDVSGHSPNSSPAGSLNSSGSPRVTTVGEAHPRLLSATLHQHYQEEQQMHQHHQNQLHGQARHGHGHGVVGQGHGHGHAAALPVVGGGPAASRLPTPMPSLARPHQAAAAGGSYSTAPTAAVSTAASGRVGGAGAGGSSGPPVVGGTGAAAVEAPAGSRLPVLKPRVAAGAGPVAGASTGPTSGAASGARQGTTGASSGVPVIMSAQQAAGTSHLPLAPRRRAGSTSRGTNSTGL